MRTLFLCLRFRVPSEARESSCRLHSEVVPSFHISKETLSIFRPQTEIEPIIPALQSNTSTDWLREEHWQLENLREFTRKLLTFVHSFQRPLGPRGERGDAGEIHLLCLDVCIIEALKQSLVYEYAPVNSKKISRMSNILQRSRDELFVKLFEWEILNGIKYTYEQN